MLPALLFSVIRMLLTLWVSCRLAGPGMGHFRENHSDIANTRARMWCSPAYSIRISPIWCFFARQVDPRDGDLSQVLVDDSSHPERT